MDHVAKCWSDSGNSTMLTVNDSLLLRAARGESTERPPLWLMRQAGRCDPAYRELRASSKLHLEELFRHPELAARISLLPARWGVDGLIIFQDILSPFAQPHSSSLLCSCQQHMSHRPQKIFRIQAVLSGWNMKKQR